MRYLIPRYLFGLLLGCIFGLVFPTLIPRWLLALLVVCFLICNEIVGRWGFGNRWHDYRIDSFYSYSGIVISIWAGVLLGTGAIGRTLIAIGTLIS